MMDYRERRPGGREQGPGQAQRYAPRIPEPEQGMGRITVPLSSTDGSSITFSYPIVLPNPSRSIIGATLQRDGKPDVSVSVGRVIDIAHNDPTHLDLVRSYQDQLHGLQTVKFGQDDSVWKQPLGEYLHTGFARGLFPFNFDGRVAALDDEYALRTVQESPPGTSLKDVMEIGRELARYQNGAQNSLETQINARLDAQDKFFPPLLGSENNAMVALGVDLTYRVLSGFGSPLTDELVKIVQGDYPPDIRHSAYSVLPTDVQREITEGR